MSLLSVITAVYRPDPGQLREAYESVRSQELPAGWTLEWCVQEDGTTGAAEEILPAAPFIAFGRGRHLGVAATRNLALSRAAGSLIKNLDQDDVLAPGVLGRDIRAMSAHPDVQWSTSRALDLLPDGSTAGFDGDPAEGKLQPGAVLDWWRSHDFRLPVHPATACFRRRLLVALGGWMAIHGSDDTGLLIAASVVSTGWFHRETGLLYRKWAGQASAQASHTEPAEWGARMSLISERADALRATFRAP